MAALLRPLRRLRFGRSELTAVSIVSGIVLLTGLMLAGFGAANKEGLADRYTAKAAVAETADGQRIRSQCTMVSTSGESCEDTWARAMAGGHMSLWNGDDDWMESECRYTYVCYEQAASLPTPSSLPSAVPATDDDRHGGNR